MPFVVIAISQTLRILELGIFSEEEIESGLKHKVPFIDNDIEISNSQSKQTIKNGKKKIKNIVIAGLIIANLFTFSGCAKNVPCDINGNHAHYYINDEYFGRHVVSEKSSVSGLNRSDNYIPVSKEDAELLEFVNKKGLFRIDENQQAISNTTDSHQDFIEYRYKYFYLMTIPIVQHNKGTIHTKIRYVPIPGYSWTTNTSKNLTGEERICHYV